MPAMPEPARHRAIFAAVLFLALSFVAFDSVTRANAVERATRAPSPSGLVPQVTAGSAWVGPGSHAAIVPDEFSDGYQWAMLAEQMTRDRTLRVHLVNHDGPPAGR